MLLNNIMNVFFFEAHWQKNNAIALQIDEENREKNLLLPTLMGAEKLFANKSCVIIKVVYYF